MPEGLEDTRTIKQKAEDLLDQKHFNAFPFTDKGALAIDDDGHAFIFDGKSWVKANPKKNPG